MHIKTQLNSLLNQIFEFKAFVSTEKCFGLALSRLCATFTEPNAQTIGADIRSTISSIFHCIDLNFVMRKGCPTKGMTRVSRVSRMRRMSPTDKLIAYYCIIVFPVSYERSQHVLILCNHYKKRSIMLSEEPMERRMRTNCCLNN